MARVWVDEGWMHGWMKGGNIESTNRPALGMSVRGLYRIPPYTAPYPVTLSRPYRLWSALLRAHQGRDSQNSKP
jgi:hypothetical protein